MGYIKTVIQPSIDILLQHSPLTPSHITSTTLEKQHIVTCYATDDAVRIVNSFYYNPNHT
jgi:hypothetical protein